MKTSPQAIGTLSRRLPQSALHAVLETERGNDRPRISLRAVTERLEALRGDLRIVVGLALATMEPKDAEVDYADAKQALSGETNPFLQDVRAIVGDILGR